MTTRAPRPHPPQHPAQQPPERSPSAPPVPLPDSRTPFLQGMLSGALLTAVATGIVLLVLWRPEPAPMTIHAPPAVEPTPAPPTAAPAPLLVDVQGAVAQPGVYTLPPGARVDDALRAAGGLAPDADVEAINRAQPLADGAQLRVPAQGESAQVPFAVAGEGSRSVVPVSLMVNVNTATQAELEALPGIGPVTAQKIIAGRPYADVDDLERVSGIGPATLEELRPYVTTH